jgi:hypothetical protein
VTSTVTTSALNRCTVPVAGNLTCPIILSFLFAGEISSVSDVQAFSVQLRMFLAQILNISDIRIEDLTVSSGSIAVRFNLADSANPSDASQNDIATNLTVLVDKPTEFVYANQAYETIPGSLQAKDSSAIVSSMSTGSNDGAVVTTISLFPSDTSSSSQILSTQTTTSTIIDAQNASVSFLGTLILSVANYRQ